MKAGELDRRITFQTETQTVTATGGINETFTDLATVWARVRPLKGEEKFQFEQSTAFNVYEFNVRYQSRFNDYKNRISYDGRFYDIIGINELGRREALLIIGKVQV